MTRDLARARLLTIDGFGHTELPNPSACAIGYEVGRMLTKLRLRGRVQAVVYAYERGLVRPRSR